MDSLESVPEIIGQTSNEDLISGLDDHDSMQGALKEIMVVGLGNKGSRPLLFLRAENELMIYQVINGLFCFQYWYLKFYFFRELFKSQYNFIFTGIPICKRKFKNEVPTITFRLATYASS